MSLLVLAGALVFGPAAADPFGPQAQTRPATAPTVEGSVDGGFLRDLAHTQSRLNGRISREIKAVRDDSSPFALGTLLALAFFYGVLHAAGPGHGKTLVASYLMAHDAHWTSGVVMGGVISLLQGVSAIVIVFLLSLLLHAKGFEIRDRGALIEVICYGLVALIGLAMLIGAVTGRGHLHAHGPLDRAGHAHDHAHDHNHNHGERAPPLLWRRVLVTAAGVAPCASAIIFMLFALANDAMGLGIAAVMALSLGMGLTVSAIGVLSIIARRFLQRLVGGGHGYGIWLERLLAIGGSLAVTGFALLLMLGAWAEL